MFDEKKGRIHMNECAQYSTVQYGTVWDGMEIEWNVTKFGSAISKIKIYFSGMGDEIIIKIN